jgi:hypothetical protein
MNDFTRYRAIGESFYGLTQEDTDDILDFRNMTWTVTQLESDLHEKSMPVGLLLFDVITKEVYEVVKEHRKYGWVHTIKIKETNIGQEELVSDIL